jgi:hypothetical protein
MREEYCWLVAGGWFVVREKYCWLVADKPNEQGVGVLRRSYQGTISACSPAVCSVHPTGQTNAA